MTQAITRDAASQPPGRLTDYDLYLFNEVKGLAARSRGNNQNAPIKMHYLEHQLRSLLVRSGVRINHGIRTRRNCPRKT